MSKKLFSLIHGEKLHVAPGAKIIPAESISKALDAAEVIEVAKNDAEKYKIEVASECEKLKEQAQKQGFEQGYAAWTQRIADLEEEIKKVRQDSEGLIIPIALKAAKKIVGRELQVSESTVVDIISNSLKAVATHKRIKIYVNKKELELVEKHKEALKRIFEHLEALSILSQDEIEPAGCIIETEGGIINAQLDNQWMILENAFQRLMKHAKTPVQEETKPKAELPQEKKPEPMKEEKKEEKKEAAKVEEEEPKEEESEWEDDEDWDEDDWDEDEDEDDKRS